MYSGVPIESPVSVSRSPPAGTDEEVTPLLVLQRGVETADFSRDSDRLGGIKGGWVHQDDIRHVAMVPIAQR